MLRSMIIFAAAFGGSLAYFRYRRRKRGGE